MRWLLLVLSLALCGCSGWNEQKAAFDSRAEFQASPYAGHVPANLLPDSARDIHFMRNRDTTAVELSFDFDESAHEALVQPFLSFDQLRMRMAMAEHGGPTLPLPSLLLRCGDGPMEFLQIDPPGHARYWTDWDTQRRLRACTNGASRSPASI